MPVVVLELVHLPLGVDFIAGARGQTADSGAAQKLAAHLGQAEQKQQGQIFFHDIDLLFEISPDRHVRRSAGRGTSLDLPLARAGFLMLAQFLGRVALPTAPSALGSFGQFFNHWNISSFIRLSVPIQAARFSLRQKNFSKLFLQSLCQRGWFAKPLEFDDLLLSEMKTFSLGCRRLSNIGVEKPHVGCRA